MDGNLAMANQLELHPDNPENYKDMKKQDLRIGNNVIAWINDIETIVAEVTELHDLILWVKHDTDKGYSVNQSGSYNSFQPIILTDDWLEKFGFRSNEGKTWWSHEIHTLVQYSKQQSGIFLARSQSSVISSPIIYVHQLQNLYFALTQSELTINPEMR